MATIEQSGSAETDQNNVSPNQGESDSVILRCNQTLKLETAIQILNNTDQYKVLNKVPETPKGGDTYLLIPLSQKDEGKKNSLLIFTLKSWYYFRLLKKVITLQI